MDSNLKDQQNVQFMSKMQTRMSRIHRVNENGGQERYEENKDQLNQNLELTQTKPPRNAQKNPRIMKQQQSYELDSKESYNNIDNISNYSGTDKIQKI